jgi:hypothetical protein
VLNYRKSVSAPSMRHGGSDSSKGLLRVLRTSRRSSGGRPQISFSMAYSAAIRSSAHRERSGRLEKHCRRDVEAMTKLFHLLSVQLPLFLQNQGHNTFTAQVVRKVLLSESVRIH